MREIVTLECTVCKCRKYMTTLDTRGGKKIEQKKYCKVCSARVIHRSRKP